jgi:hypothetical protein
MIVLYNPHVDDFLAEPPHFRLFKRRPLKKYGFFIEESLRNNQVIQVLVDGTSSAFIPEKVFHKLPKFLRQFISKLEYQRWCRINNFSSLVKRVSAPREKSNEILLAFSYKAATGDFSIRRELLGKYKAVVFHLSHYFILTKEKSDHIKKLDNAWLAGDSDITDIDYFKQSFPWYKKEFLVLPFCVVPRFKIRKEWSDRQNRCVATGSFHDLEQERSREKYAYYMSTTQLTTYHPVRKQIYEQAESLSNVIECRVSPYRQYASGSKLQRLIKHFSVAQKKYFSIDIVNLYNDYRFAVVGEELSGFPALGALESMACGCTLIAEKKYYEKLGLIPQQHYLSYDGTVQSLVETVQSQQVNRCDEIAKAGANFVANHFSPSSVFQRWCSQFMKL